MHITNIKIGQGFKYFDRFGYEDDISEYKKKIIPMMNQVVSEFNAMAAEGEQYLQRIEKGDL